MSLSLFPCAVSTRGLTWARGSWFVLTQPVPCGIMTELLSYSACGWTLLVPSPISASWRQANGHALQQIGDKPMGLGPGFSCFENVGLDIQKPWSSVRATLDLQTICLHDISWATSATSQMVWKSCTLVLDGDWSMCLYQTIHIATYILIYFVIYLFI